MRYVIDIDNTICYHIGIFDITDYGMALPIVENIMKANKLYDEDHEIIYYTARGSGTGIDHRELTEQQFKDWNVKYHELHFGKPYADVYIDDKALNVEDWQ